MELSRICLWEVFPVSELHTEYAITDVTQRIKSFLKIAGVLETVLSLHARGGKVFPHPVTGVTLPRY